MKALKVHVACFVAFAIMVSGAALTDAQQQPEKIKVKIEIRVGDEVTLFYGRSGDMEKEFPLGQEMGVYTRNLAFGLNQNEKIGKLKILGYGGEYFIIAEVVEGTIGRPGDAIKLKSGVGSLCMACPPSIEKK